MSLTSINNLYSSNGINAYPAVTQDEFQKIQDLCKTSIDFERLHSENGPKNRPNYIARKTSELFNRFGENGGKLDPPIIECFRRTLETIVPHPLLVRTFIPDRAIPPPEPRITTEDWWEVAVTIARTPEDVFKRHFEA